MSNLFYFLTFGSVGDWLKNPTWKTRWFTRALWLAYPVVFFFHAAYMAYSVFPFTRFLMSTIFVFLMFSWITEYSDIKIFAQRFAFTFYVWYIATALFQYAVGFTHIVEVISY